MTIRTKDKNRAELVKTIIKQNGGRIFTVVAKRKSPKTYFVVGRSVRSVLLSQPVSEGDKFYLNTKKNKLLLEELKQAGSHEITETTEHFMKMTCRTGVKKELKGGNSTIKHVDSLISVNLTDGGGYRCFSAYNVLSIKAGGAEINFKEEDVLSCEGE